MDQFGDGDIDGEFVAVVVEEKAAFDFVVLIINISVFMNAVVVINGLSLGIEISFFRREVT